MRYIIIVYYIMLFQSINIGLMAQQQLCYLNSIAVRVLSDQGLFIYLTRYCLLLDSVSKFLAAKLDMC